jgi:predicted DNA-binding transcriptional regulator AlpA
MSVTAAPWHLVMEFVGIDLDDDAVTDALAPTDTLDVLWSSSEGVATAEATVDAESLALAVAAVVTTAMAAAPEAALVRLVDPLVAISDIADFAGVSRQAARNWALGTRQSGFPRPVAVVGDGIRVWRQAEVNRWLIEALALGDDRRFPSASEVAGFNERGFDALRDDEQDPAVPDRSDEEWFVGFSRSETQPLAPQQQGQRITRTTVTTKQ